MNFQLRENTTPYSIHEWSSGRYVIAELNFMFGQHRIQIWDERIPSYGEVVLPNF